MATYEENKYTIQTAINRIKAIDYERGAYLQKHVVFDDDEQTICYSGEPLVLAGILEEANIF